MRPHFIEIQAFGPYVEKQRIDFSKFSNNLFLLHGPTGAGKTTIFDAMSCALYGTSTGSREGKKMRSDFAQDDLPTLIRFCFCLRGNYFTACYKAEKKRSEGFKPKRLFYRSTPEGNFLENERVYTKEEEIKAQIEQLLQINENQFLQVVVLPQGEFQKFLRASGSKKEEILSNIFQTQRFKNFQEQLKNCVKQAEEELQQFQSIYQTLLESANIPEGNSLEERLQELVNHRKQLTTKLVELETTYEQARRVFEQARILAEEIGQIEEIQKGLNEHRSSKKQLDDWIQKKQQIEKAIQLKPIFDKAKEIKNKINQLEQNEHSLEEKQKTTQSQLECFQKKQLAHQGEQIRADQARHQAQRLKEQLQDFVQVEEIVKQINQKKESIQAILEDQKRKREKLEELEKQISNAEEKKLQLHSAAERADFYQSQEISLKQQQKQLQELLQKRQQLEKARLNLQVVAQQYEIAQQQAEISREQYILIERQWRNNQAALLAEILQSGQPCPVCGSLHHPNPARSHGERVTDEELEKAQKNKETAENNQQKALKAYQAARNEYDQIKAACQVLENNFSEVPQPETIATKLKQITNLRIQSEQAKNQLPQIEQKISQLRQENGNLQTQLEKTKELFQQQQKELASLEGRLQTLRERLLFDFATQKEVQDRISKLEQFYQQWEEQKKQLEEIVEKKRHELVRLETQREENKRSLASLKRELEQLKEQAMHLCYEKGFASLSEANQWVQKYSEPYLKQLNDSIEQWNKKELQLKEQLKILLDRTGGKPKPDIENLRRKVEAAKQDFQNCQQQVISLEHQISQLEKMSHQLRQISMQIAEKESALMPLKQLHLLASGDNSERLSLHHFILRFYFQEVIAKANYRLKQLSGGRYLLYNETERTNRKDGMQLSVFDHYTGTTRPVENLSGGETFFTSLALALGLSDVITSQSGNVRLESMFIDEGFGTLDSDALDLAIRTLSELEGSNRLVGIISHVSELKERIPAKIEVIKTQRGSRIIQH